jgi:hypothetical protein
MTLLGDLLKIYEVSKKIKLEHEGSEENCKIIENISDGLNTGDIRICIFCAGFVDITVNDCPNCYKSLGLFDNKTQAIEFKAYNKKDINDFINEGQYIGRYSRGDTIILNNVTED